MSTRIALEHDYFTDRPRTILEHDGITVTAFRYDTGVEALRLQNQRGHIIVLPYLGQMIWDVVFDGRSLTMLNMFDQPRTVDTVVDTYGCFAFHSGLLSNGCPAPEDTHPLHGEMPCAPMDRAWLDVRPGEVGVGGVYHYVQGFGHHYEAKPSVTITTDRPRLSIDMAVTNLSKYQPMPLQYMCHMNYAYVEDARFTQSMNEEVFHLRDTVPAHVQPTPEWEELNAEIQRGEVDFSTLAEGHRCDPEIVFFADDLARHGEVVEFGMHSPAGYAYSTKFATADFNYATRWLLWNPDQQVAAFCLPATCRPEGHLAAVARGTLIELAPGATRTFHVDTGVKEDS
ncbi:aldose 1-epimerase family protein [Enemella sp. A6]|uniref:aldose 1-epimerase family protein n=1 Tax=Enemella sp. A6 TaxID=3440152 RepID=UPI003EC04E35